MSMSNHFFDYDLTFLRLLAESQKEIDKWGVCRIRLAGQVRLYRHVSSGVFNNLVRNHPVLSPGAAEVPVGSPHVRTSSHAFQTFAFKWGVKRRRVPFSDVTLLSFNGTLLTQAKDGDFCLLAGCHLFVHE